MRAPGLRILAWGGGMGGDPCGDFGGAVCIFGEGVDLWRNWWKRAGFEVIGERLCVGMAGSGWKVRTFRGCGDAGKGGCGVGAGWCFCGDAGSGAGIQRGQLAVERLRVLWGWISGDWCGNGGRELGKCGMVGGVRNPGTVGPIRRGGSGVRGIEWDRKAAGRWGAGGIVQGREGTFLRGFWRGGLVGWETLVRKWGKVWEWSVLGKWGMVRVMGRWCVSAGVQGCGDGEGVLRGGWARGVLSSFWGRRGWPWVGGSCGGGGTSLGGGQAGAFRAPGDAGCYFFSAGGRAVLTLGGERYKIVLSIRIWRSRRVPWRTGLESSVERFDIPCPEAL